MALKETILLKEIRRVLSPRTILFRQTVGTFMTLWGQKVKIGFKGTPDLCGWTVIEITPEMVGKKFPIFTAIEVKTGDLKETKRQSMFIAGVLKAGGFAGTAYKVEDAKKICER